MSKLVIDLSQPAPVPQSLEEAQQLIAALWQLLVELQKRQAELEEQLNTHSENSSKPPSQDSPKQRAERPSKKPTGRAKGAQPGHGKHERALLDASAVDRIEHYYPQSQCACGGEVVMDGYRRHQVFDLPEVRYQVVEHRCYSGCCRQCKARHRAALPDDVPSGQMGPGLIAWISLLNSQYHLSLRQLESLLAEQWQLDFSLGAISEAQAPVIDWLLPVYQQIGDQVRDAGLAHADETSHFRGKSRYWLWSLSTPQAAYFMTHYSRGKQAARELLGDFDGILVTDRHGAYNDYDADRHQYCWAHIIRNLEKISGRSGQAGEDGTYLLRLARLVVHCGKRWQHSGCQSLLYRRRLQRLRQHFQATLERTATTHGDTRTGHACRKLLRDSPRLWTFLKYQGVPMTNNAAEQSLRPYVIWRKISFFTQSHRGNQFRPMMLSLIETCKRLKVNVYQTLRTVCWQGVMEGHVSFRLPFPALACLPSASGA
ncbi:IS66 family transposase [Methylomicrobium lacus]|uniref:IS66 family transposase n=1 Tax=Methylomicrobium lacus TaxID=136992 RepID=UPI0035A9A915